MTDELTFEIHGHPVAKGSKRAFPIKRKDGRLSVAVREELSERQKTWAGQLTHVFQEAATNGAPLLEGPVVVKLHFAMPRPKRLPKTRTAWPTTRPDLDKLTRLVLDCLQGVLLVDDSQVVNLTVRTRYAAPGGRPGVRITLLPLQEEP